MIESMQSVNDDVEFTWEMLCHVPSTSDKCLGTKYHMQSLKNLLLTLETNFSQTIVVCISPFQVEKHCSLIPSTKNKVYFRKHFPIVEKRNRQGNNI